MEPRQDIDNRNPGLGRSVVTRHAHESTHGLHEQVVAGHLRTITGTKSTDGAVHGSRIPVKSLWAVEPISRQAARREILNDNVGYLG